MNAIREMLDPGSLWARVLEATEQAMDCGALVSIPTTVTTIVDQGIAFHVRVVANLERKARERQQRDIFKAPSPKDPFLPYEEEMFVADLSETHVCVLNKFNVVDHHVLMVTRGFEHQLAPLTREDFHALCVCLAEYPGVAFYNAGETAGASQPHKHVQFVAEADLAVGGAQVSGDLVSPSPIPITPLIERIEPTDGTVTLSTLPFDHRVVRFARPLGEHVSSCVDRLMNLYDSMLSDLELEHLDARAVEESPRFLENLPERPTSPYNLLCTRDWMMMVPRRRECFESISVNALGFCGALLMRNEVERERLEAVGPMRVLAHTGRPLSGGG